MGAYDDIIGQYLPQAARLIQNMENGLLEIESPEPAEDAAHTMHRAIHALKAGAAIAGLDQIVRLSRKMDTILGLVRTQELTPEQPIVDALWQSLDTLKALIEQGGEEDNPALVDGPIRALDTAFTSCMDSATRSSHVQKGMPLPGSDLPAFEVSAHALGSKLSQGNLFYVRLDPAQMESRGVDALELANQMLAMGELLDIRFQPSGEEASLQALYFTVLEESLLESALKIQPEEYRRLSREDFSWPEGGGEEAAAEETPPASPPPAPSKPAKERPKPERPPAPKSPKPAATSASTPAPTPKSKPAPPAEPASPSEIKAGEYLTFSLGDEEYGVEITSVQEIMGPPPLARLPKEPPYVLGVMNLRGMVVPVVDLRLRLGLEPRDKEGVVMVLLVGDKIMGAVVDGVNDVVRFMAEDIQKAPDFAGTVDKKHLRGLGRGPKDLVILLELDNLLLPDNSAHAA